ncbi:hydroxyquinol 1,2-dioxygenase [Variovorax boronicumulans]|uniref:intradiol ring-cleavage dioxygenase n=1 Tax=Variovorax boronicumulans TaxID=436515 RepID=UPI0027824576|nr:intradiol ring-cleavage dioxygenase [Variovorax boronicumulans]MDP9920470.1 hydroxyquinol 1,2-dioxygenase [Variovorax boronicumulans]
MRNLDEDNITRAVIGTHANAGNARLRELMTSLVQHLHAFARETALTEEEWLKGIQFLTEIGHITTDKRQEFILLSDTLGLSMLVTALNNRKPEGCTESTVFGPFHVENSPQVALGGDVANGAQGEPCFVRGTVSGLDGRPVPGAELQVWQADEAGYYDVQYGDNEPHRARATLNADAAGGFHFKTIRAVAYPIPHDGPVGKMLEALGRHPWRPAHLHFMITAPGYERLITHVFRNGDRYLDSDAVFGVRSSLVADWVEHPPGITPDGTRSEVPFYTLDFEFVLNPDGNLSLAQGLPPRS